MNTIKLRNGLDVFIDEDDYDNVKRYRWNLKSNGDTCKYAVTYIYGNNKQKVLRMHRLIMNPAEGEEIDHINGNGLDNRKCNLRIASAWQNNMNVRKNKVNTSGFKGVDKSLKKWKARIQYGRKRIHIGTYNNKIDAAKAYDKKARELFGEFANLNFK
jgi:hypothetical protein